MSIFRRLICRIGHRGSFLLFLALLDALYGYSILAEPLSAAASLNVWLPFQAWGIVWITVGFILLTGVPVRHDRFQFGLAAALKAAWAAAWLNIWVFQDFPRAWISVIIWAAFAAIVVIVSSWPEVRRRTNYNHEIERRHE